MRFADRRAAKARLKRRGFPIHAYVGPNGHGKSLAMVYDTLPSLEHDRPVLSTVRLLDYENPRPCDDVLCEYPGHPDHGQAHPLYVPFTDYQQLIDWRDGDVLMDEVTGIASSREVASMPVQVANYLVQLRRRNVSLRWTAPAWGRADKIIREVTQAVTLCMGFAPKRRPPVPGQPARLWYDRRMFVFRTYDAMLMDDFTNGNAVKLKAAPWQMIWRPGLHAPVAYDTLDPVTALGWANDAGLCMRCGGKRSHVKCSCGDHGRPVKSAVTSLAGEEVREHDGRLGGHDDGAEALGCSGSVAGAVDGDRLLNLLDVSVSAPIGRHRALPS